MDKKTISILLGLILLLSCEVEYSRIIVTNTKWNPAEIVITNMGTGFEEYHENIGFQTIEFSIDPGRYKIVLNHLATDYIIDSELIIVNADRCSIIDLTFK